MLNSCGNQWQQRQSVAISGNHESRRRVLNSCGNQWQPVATSGNQWQSVAVSGNQWQSVAVSGNQWPAHLLHVQRRQVVGRVRERVLERAGDLQASGRHGTLSAEVIRDQ